MTDGQDEYVLNVEHDKLIDEIDKRMAEEYARGSDASESAAKTKEYLEMTGLNSQAFSWLKTILKKLPKKDGAAKAMDIIRSLEVGLGMVKNHVLGQSTAEMDFSNEEDDGESGDTEEAEAAPADEGKKPATASKKASGGKDAKSGKDENVQPIDFGKASAAGRG